MTETTASSAPDASTIVAQSLGTIGYAMFSLSQTGPLNQLETFSEVMKRGSVLVPVNIGEDDPADEVPEAEESAFGAAEVDEHMGAVTQPAPVPPAATEAPGVPVPAVPLPTVDSATKAASSALMAIGPDGRPVGAPAPAPQQPQAPAAESVVPAPDGSGAAAKLPEYHKRSSQSLDVLRDLTFLDD